jgi:hypothetical protein
MTPAADLALLHARARSAHKVIECASKKIGFFVGAKSKSVFSPIFRAKPTVLAIVAGYADQ